MIQEFFFKLLNKVDRNTFIFSSLFVLFIFFFERFFFSVNYRNYLLSLLEFGLHNVIFASFIVLLSWICFFLFVYFSLVSTWRYKIIYLSIFIFATFHEYSYQNVFQRFSSFKDVHIALATTPEQKLNAIIAYFSIFAFIPIVVYLLKLIILRPKPITHQLKSLLFILILFTVLYTCLSVTLQKNNIFLHPTVSTSAFVRTGISYLYFRYETFIKPERETIEPLLLPDSYIPKNNIVFIVDESIRGDHLSLNGYARKTTPYLDELSQNGWLKNWGIAVSASTCSVFTHDILLTGLLPDDFPDTENKMDRFPLIFQYAKAMKYKTYYIDGQMDTYWGILEYDGNSYVDTREDVMTINRENKVPYSDTDFQLAKKINNIISSSSGNFIFVFKKGVHLPYNNAFPDESIVWEPSFVGKTPYSLPPEEHESLVNSYDNGIRYNSDNFFKNLASDYSNLPNNTVIIYTGDHGQTLGEDGENYPHCGYSKNEAMVPLFMLGNLGKEVDTNFKASHMNLFATILDLMNYPEELRKQQYAPSLLKTKVTDSTERYYVPFNSQIAVTDLSKVKFD